MIVDNYVIIIYANLWNITAEIFVFGIEVNGVFIKLLIITDTFV